MNTTMKPVPRSMLFTPATKASRFDKAAEVGAAAVILDLEDSVATAAKDQARRAALNYLGSDRLSGVQTALRINAPATLAGWQDLTALLQSSCDPDFVVVPKAESAAAAGLVKSLLAQARKAARVVVIYESARAVTQIGALLDARGQGAVLHLPALAVAFPQQDGLAATPDSESAPHTCLLCSALANGRPVHHRMTRRVVKDYTCLRTKAASEREMPAHQYKREFRPALQGGTSV